MSPEFSLAHLTVLGTTPLELIDIAASATYDYVSIRATPVARGEQITPLAGDPAMVRQVVHRLADTGVRVLDVELARIGPDDEPDGFVEVLEAADHFGRLCELALDYGLTVDLEFPSWSPTGDLAAAAAVVRAVYKANAGILVDALHFFRSHSSLDSGRPSGSK